MVLEIGVGTYLNLIDCMTIKVKIVAECDDQLFYHEECSSKSGKPYTLYLSPTNSNQAEMCCAGCHGFLGFDHAIQLPAKK